MISYDNNKPGCFLNQIYSFELLMNMDCFKHD